MAGRITRRRSPLILLGLAVIGLLAAMAVWGVLRSPQAPIQQRLSEGLAAPSWEHPLGQDRLGRDQWSRLLAGARISLLVGAAVVSVSLMIGLLVGGAAGLAGGWIDELLMRLTDILLAFPGLLLAIALTAVLGPGLDHVILALCAMGWVGYARLVRGQLLSLREREYVVAARAIGVPRLRLFGRHLLPNLAGPLLVEASFGMAHAIVAEASLSFLGLGIQPPAPSWGSMLAEGRAFGLLAPHLTLAPGLAIMIVVLGLNLLGDGLRDLLDARGSAHGAPF
ncbi:MAG: ABC transporter permease [Nitrospirota bacterium]